MELKGKHGAIPAEDLFERPEMRNALLLFREGCGVDAEVRARYGEKERGRREYEGGRGGGRERLWIGAVSGDSVLRAVDKVA